MIEEPFASLYRSETIRAMRIVADRLSSLAAGSRRSIVDLAVSVRRQNLRQAMQFGTRLRNRRTGQEAIYVGCKPLGYEEAPLGDGSRRLRDRVERTNGTTTALVWTVSVDPASTGHSQSVLSDWVATEVASTRGSGRQVAAGR